VRYLEEVVPDVTIGVGRAQFRVWTSERGIKRIVLPPQETVIGGRKKHPVDVNINRKLSLDESRRVADVASFLESVLGRRPREACPCIDLEGLSAFTRSVLETTIAIPWGETRSYKWVACRIGKPGAARAVGQALGRNPVPLVIPCHRVVKEDGTIGGFGAGIDWKEWLLEIELNGKRH
jgi:methylated-DNA-[protein]-cysteine S-methyltransferase